MNTHNNRIAIDILLDAWQHYDKRKEMSSDVEDYLKAALLQVVIHFGTQEQYYLLRDNY